MVMRSEYVKAAAAGGGADQATPKMPSPGETKPEILPQRRKLGGCPAKMAIGGAVVVAAIGYFTLYAKKKPEATAMDVAKVASGSSSPR